MNNFTYYCPTEIVFGKNTHHQIGSKLKHIAKKVLLHYGGGSIKKSGLYDDVVKSLEDNHIQFVELGGVMPNPRLSLVKEGVKLCRSENVDFILAVGGGSVIDSAKAIGIGALYNGNVWDFYSGKAQAQDTIPVATILTIPAAGSESSPNSVITDEDTMTKAGAGADCMRPVFSILNPEFCFTIPKNHAANGICDMMAHIFERYFTNTQNVDLTDKLCEATLKSIMKNAPIVINDMTNYDAWAEIMWGGSIAHVGLLGTGRTEDWASHGIEHQLSAVYDIAHGAGLAIIFPAWMKYVNTVNKSKFLQFAKNVMDVTDNAGTDNETISQAIKRVEEFFEIIGLETRLSQIGIDDSNFESMARKATAYGNLGSFMELSMDDVVNIYKLAL